MSASSDSTGNAARPSRGWPDELNVRRWNGRDWERLPDDRVEDCLRADRDRATLFDYARYVEALAELECGQRFTPRNMDEFLTVNEFRALYR